MKVLHLVKIRFDRRESKIDQTWLDRRYEFFLNHTYKSLQAQTNKDWRLWIQCGEGIKPEHIQRLRDELQHEAWFSFGDHALPLAYPFGQEYDWIYVTRLDSDDLYAPDALEIARHCTPNSTGPEASVFKRGYLHELASGRTGVYRNESSPFHTLMIPRSIWTDHERYMELWRKVGDHSRVASTLPTYGLPDFKFTVLIHSNNFVSTYDYGRERGFVEKNWNINLFLNRPVVFDVDDFSDMMGGEETLNCLTSLKAHYPNFRCTLFCIPSLCSPTLLKSADKMVKEGWLELALHGWTHYPTEELKKIPPKDLVNLYRGSIVSDNPIWTKGFRPPGWYITREHIKALNELGMWVALHKNDKELCQYAEHGHYICEDRYPYFHGHTHDVCGNWLKKCLPALLTQWPKYQAFSKVSESLCVKSY